MPMKNLRSTSTRLDSRLILIIVSTRLTPFVYVYAATARGREFARMLNTSHRKDERVQHDSEVKNMFLCSM